ncbi:hypothetical protein N7537_012256 [Penicillium hordei]|uniref:Uncharacterized protein n=1 Tax=Penicillium hordei TaxID=40994 RepID=A0AAD6DNB5_9EURO|nr:uncharacterized protein N7537_012256 [Penicillium hordei]KAJ5589578.1 hypothetical protein N7537_012256 [Penicillium hordei]
MTLPTLDHLMGKSDFVSSATMMASEYKSHGGYNTKGRRPDGSSETPRYLGEKEKEGTDEKMIEESQGGKQFVGNTVR